MGRSLPLAAAPGIERALLDYVKEAYFAGRRGSTAGPLGRRELQAARPWIERLSDGLTIERDRLRGGYLARREFRSAYLLHFFLPGLIKSAYLAAGMAGELAGGPAHAGRPLRLLDLGSGPGAAGLGAVLALSAPAAGGRPVRLTAVDGVGPVLDDLRALAPRLAAAAGVPAPELATLKLALGPGGRSLARIAGEYDLILAANVLNELAAPAAGLLAGLLDRLAPGGALIAIEPATQSESGALYQARDELAAGRGLRIFGPCTRDGACPLLAAGGRDWCFAAVPWRPPGIARAIAGRHERERLKMAPLVIAPAERWRPPADCWRVVSDPIAGHGRVDLLLCGQVGKLRLSLPPAHGLLADPGLHRGAWLEAGLEIDRGRARLTGRGWRFGRGYYPQAAPVGRPPG